MIKVSPASARDSSLHRCLGDRFGTELIQRLSHLGIRTVAKLANRVAARIWQVAHGAGIYRTTPKTLFQNYELHDSGRRIGAAPVSAPGDWLGRLRGCDRNSSAPWLLGDL